MSILDFLFNRNECRNSGKRCRITYPVDCESIFRESFSFHVERFEEWNAGRCVNSGTADFDISVQAGSYGISCNIPNASKFRMKSPAVFGFIGSAILSDRIQYINAPGASEDSTMPLILHVFVRNLRIDCIRFAMSFPDRVVEFYGYQTSF